MDSRKPPDTNVVRLLRSSDLSDEERRRLASTIFAEQDEVGTFSRGNLVPPSSTTPPTGEDPSAGDPFFEELETTSPRDQTRTPAVAGERDTTAAYFERLGSQTPAEMSQGITPQPAAAAMPGSANLPGEVATRPRQNPHYRLVSRPWSRRSLPIPRIHLAAPALLGVLAVLLAASAALAAIVGGGGHGAHGLTAGYAEGKRTLASQREPGDSPSSGSRAFALELPAPRYAPADHTHRPPTSRGEKARLGRGSQAGSARRASSEHRQRRHHQHGNGRDLAQLDRLIRKRLPGDPSDAIHKQLQRDLNRIRCSPEPARRPNRTSGDPRTRTLRLLNTNGT